MKRLSYVCWKDELCCGFEFAFDFTIDCVLWLGVSLCWFTFLFGYCLSFG